MGLLLAYTKPKHIMSRFTLVQHQTDVKSGWLIDVRFGRSRASLAGSDDRGERTYSPFGCTFMNCIYSGWEHRRKIIKFNLMSTNVFVGGRSRGRVEPASRLVRNGTGSRVGSRFVRYPRRSRAVTSVSESGFHSVYDEMYVPPYISKLVASSIGGLIENDELFLAFNPGLQSGWKGTISSLTKGIPRVKLLEKVMQIWALGLALKHAAMISGEMCNNQEECNSRVKRLYCTT
ncbi:hypothetical protein Leryth_023497 [Lithospermum erythrorhizon]|nr:hypothetical protein Leryth_023497 [Lithospermum erythrorhizon]